MLQHYRHRLTLLVWVATGLVLLSSVGVVACQRGIDIEEFSQQLLSASESEQGAQQFLDSLSVSEPIGKTLATSYISLLDAWQYVEDEPGLNIPKSAEQTFIKKEYTGDCEDFAVAMLSICNTLGIQCRIVIGRKGNLGHAWTEILYSRHPNQLLLNKAKDEFGQYAGTIAREDGLWIRLNPPEVLRNYTDIYFISQDGSTVLVE